MDMFEVPGLPWSCREKVLNFLKPDTALLGWYPGDCELLLSLRHPPALTVALCEPGELALCRKRLPGSRVEAALPDGTAPFAPESFELIFCRGRPCGREEIARLLRPGGFCILEQAGSGDSLAAPPQPDCNLENELPKWRAAGFRIMERGQAYLPAAPQPAYYHRFFLIVKKR